jgi:hypothetical protein
MYYDSTTNFLYYWNGTSWVAGGGSPAIYAARAHRGAAFTPPQNTFVKVPLDTVDFDPSGCINLANGRYVCPVAGIYDVAATLSSRMSGTGQYTLFTVAIYKNGVQISQNTAEPSLQSWGGASLSDKVQCIAGDYLELWMYNAQASAALSVDSTANYLAVSRLG